VAGLPLDGLTWLGLGFAATAAANAEAPLEVPPSGRAGSARASV
jgi:hypothetical protein